MPVVPPDHACTGFLIGPHHLAQLFRVKLFGERGRPYQVTEHHRQLASFSRSQSGVRSPRSGVRRSFPFSFRLCFFLFSPFSRFSDSPFPLCSCKGSAHLSQNAAPGRTWFPHAEQDNSSLLPQASQN